MSTDDSPIGEDDLQAYIDDRLDRERRRRVEDWLAQWPERREAIEADRKHREAMRASLSGIGDEPLPARLRLTEIRRELAEHRRRRLQTVAASLALLIAGGVGGWLGREAVEPPSGAAAMADATAAYRVFASDATRPVEMRADERTWLAQWLGQRVGRPLGIPNLGSVDLRFMGGRLLSTENGAAALLMYDDDRGSRVVIYVRPIDETRPKGLRQRTDEGLETHYWYDDGFGYAVTGPSEFGALPRATQAARRQLQGT